MNFKRMLTTLLILSIAATGCNLPVSGKLADEETVTPFTPAADILTPATTTTAEAGPTSCSPSLTATSSANIRSGPGTAYGSVDNLTPGATAAVIGKNNDSTWWFINRPAGGTGWVSASVSTVSCIPASLAIIAAPPTSPPTSLPAGGTCKGDYVWRLITPGDKVCISPASKAQVDSDNALADTLKATYLYGPDTCINGYSWRNAFPGDHVCVTEDVILQVAADNAAAPSRVDPGGVYGPDSCIDGFGFVWRDAGPSDHVCVTGAVRSQAAADNAAAESRKVINVYGPDACISGYVWRSAFPSDHVCVLPSVRDQTAADNADAPSHTWP